MNVRKKTLVVMAAALLALGLAGCGKSIDINSTGAQPVPGARALYRFCDGTTLIYFSHWDSSPDEYEAMWPGWCLKNKEGKWVYDSDALAAAAQGPARTDGNTDGGDGK